jgi:glycosyltransferase involved in cell wall biosynthesis
MISSFFNTSGISVIVIFYNMQREAKRTLYSLTAKYQKGINEKEFEVIAIDNGSPEPLDKGWVESLGPNFRYIFFKASTPSPSQAINHGVRKARFKNIAICIDGARILSPGILKYMKMALKTYNDPFIYTLGMHIGHKPQNLLMEEGYNQTVEDELIGKVNWEENGYRLFEISSLALSSKYGYFSSFPESNCLCLRKKTFWKVGGYDERFTGPGGGIVNLDFFNNVHEIREVTPVMILGEATFHQFHGGVATNVTMDRHPLQEMKKEYFNIKNREYQNNRRFPEYIGWISLKYHAALVSSQVSK